MPYKFIPADYNHVRVGGPPDDWNGLIVVNVDTGELIKGVIEVNVEEKWLLQMPEVMPEDRVPKAMMGNFRVYRMVDVQEDTKK